MHNIFASSVLLLQLAILSASLKSGPLMLLPLLNKTTCLRVMFVVSWAQSALDFDQDEARQKLCDWLDKAGGVCLFDFVTKGVLNEVFEKTQFWRLKDKDGKNPGLVGWWPSRAVTFIDNHDTGTYGLWKVRLAVYEFQHCVIERGQESNYFLVSRDPQYAVEGVCGTWMDSSLTEDSWPRPRNLKGLSILKQHSQQSLMEGLGLSSFVFVGVWDCDSGLFLSQGILVYPGTM